MGTSALQVNTLIAFDTSKYRYFWLLISHSVTLVYHLSVSSDVFKKKEKGKKRVKKCYVFLFTFLFHFRTFITFITDFRRK